MSISDAQFLQWLKRGSSRLTILAEPKLAYQRSGAPAEDTLYWADKPFRSKASDTVPFRQYQDVIKAAPSFGRAIDAQELGGRGTSNLGNLSLLNTSGTVDYLLNEIIDGRDIPFYVGDFDWARSDFRLVATGSMLVAKADSDDSMSVSMKDRGLLLDTSIIGTKITSGPNVGKPKPLLFGTVLNVDLTQYLIDAANLIYAMNSYAMADFTRVLDIRDGGFSLQGTPFLADNTVMTANAGTDIITKNGHGFVANDVVYFSGDIFAGLSVMTQYWILPTNLTTNTFMVSRVPNGAAEDITGTTFNGTTTVYKRRFLVDIGNATVQLASKPTQLTSDIRATGPTGNAALQGVPHIGFQYIIDNYTSLKPSDRVQSSFDALVALELNSGIQWGYALMDRTNVMDVLDQIATLTNSWYGWNNAGQLTVGRLDLPNLDSVTPIDTIRRGDIQGDPVYENQEIKFGRIIMDANKNVATQTSGLLGAVSASDASKWAQDYQLRVQTTDLGTSTYNPAWWKYHKTAVDSDPLETSLYGNTLQAQSIVDERTALFQPWIRKFSCKVGLDKYALNPGDPVKVIYPRYDLQNGQMFRVLSVNVSISDRTVDLILIRHAPADAIRVSSFTRPDPPTGVAAVGGNGQATVSWVPPVADGGSSITEYLITSSPGNIQVRGLPNLVNGTMSMVIAGLTNLTAYTFKVQATNLIGTSDPSAASNSITPDTVKFPPQPPIIGTPTRGDTQISVTFTAPTDNGGSAILDYTATADKFPFDANNTPISVVVAGSPAVITGLVNGQAYTCRVKARNAIGFSPYSGNSASSTPATIPGVPRSLNISAGNAQVFAAFQPPLSNGGDAITSYTVELRKTSDNSLVQTSAGSLSLQRTFSGLVNGTSYYADAWAINTVGVGPTTPNSNSATPLVTLNPPDTPSAPTAVRGNAQATVSWTAPGDGGSAIIDYTVTIYQGNTQVGSVTTGALSTVVTGLTNGFPYTFKVRARNGIGSSADSAASAVTTPATIPDLSGMTITAVAGNGQATISLPGSMNTGGDLPSSVVATASPGGLNAAFANPSGVAVFGGQVVITGLTNGVQYTFTIVATNSVGASAPSRPSNSVTPAVPSHQVNAGDISAASLTPNNARGSSHAIVTGGVGPFTYSWAFIVDGNGITLTGSTLDTVTAATTTSQIQVRQGTLRVTVTDTGNGNLVVTDDVNVYLEVESNV